MNIPVMEHYTAANAAGICNKDFLSVCLGYKFTLNDNGQP